MSDDQRQQFPRLAISDLIVLTLCVGFALASVAPGVRDSINRSKNEPSGVRWDVISTVVIDYMAIGIGLFGLIVLARERLRGRAVPSEPGHWMLIATAPQGVLSLTANIILPLLWLPSYWQLAHVSRCALCVLVNLMAALWTTKALRSMPLQWRISMAFVLVWLCIEAVFFIAQIGSILGHSRSSLWVGHLISINGTAYLVTCFAVCCAVVVDVTKGIRRDWLHYCGLVPIVLSAGTTVANLGWNMVGWWNRLISRLLP